VVLSFWRSPPAGLTVTGVAAVAASARRMWSTETLTGPHHIFNFSKPNPAPDFKIQNGALTSLQKS
jgi:hypothetical protein